MTDIYVKLRAQGLDDANAAIETAKHLRYIDDLRSGFREAGAIASGRPYDATADRAQLMTEADKPLSDLAQRQKAGPLAGEELGRQTGAIQSDIALQQQRGLLTPGDPANVAMREAAKQMGLNVPDTLTIPKMPPQLWATLQPLAEKRQKAAELAAGAPGRAADVALKTSEAGKTVATTAPAAALTTAETAKAEAEAAHTRMETSGQVAPGLTVTGTQGVTQKDRDELKSQKAAADKSGDLIDQIVNLTKGKDWIKDTKVHAALAPAISSLILASKEGAGIRGLPDQDIAFLKSMSGNYDPTKISNILGITHNQVRLKALKGIIYNNLKRDAEARGVTFTPPGTSSPSAAPAAANASTAATHYRISPDKKMRVATDAQGNPLGRPEPNPDAPQVPNG